MFILIKDTLDEIVVWINNNRPKFLGGLLGFILSILILSIGLFRTLFILVLTTIGYILGSYNISKDDLKKIIERVFSNR